MRTGTLVAVVATFAALVGAGCIDDPVVACANGRSCPANTACDLVHDTCVEPGQITACAGLAERTACTWSAGSGACIGGVCLVPGCGNRVVEPELGEQCDDGNHVSGDGCSADCRSDETCGNGVVDAIDAEQCDDGNLRSHDGCDSKCQLETAAWTAQGIGLPDQGPAHGVFDQALGVYVHFSEGVTWEWNGTSWKISAIGGPPPEPDWYALVYDSDRAVVVLVGASVSIPGVKPIDLMWEWDGTVWTERPTQQLAQVASGVATYDPPNHRIVVYGGNQIFALDSATATWTTIPQPPSSAPCSSVPTPGGQAIGYDPASGHVVLVLDGYIPNAGPTVAPSTWELSGTTWLTPCSSSKLGTALGTSQLVTGGKLVAFGTATGTGHSDGSTSFSYGAAVYSWTSGTPGTWTITSTSVPSQPLPSPEVGYDTTADTLLAFSDYVYVLGADGQTWHAIDVHQPQPRTDAITAFDLRGNQLILLQGDDLTEPAETWTWNGTWTQLAPSTVPPVLGGAVMAYDPIRGNVVLVDQDTKTWVFDSNAVTWTRFGTSGVRSPAAIEYDPTHRGMVALGDDGLVALASDDPDAVWTQLGPGPPISPVTSLAFDARDGVIVAFGGSGSVYSFDGALWSSTLTPGDAAYQLVADTRRGSVDVVGTENLWELVGGTWGHVTGAPLKITIRASSYAAPDGRVLLLGSVGASRILMTRQITSALPTETCAPGVDADGDGLAGCDDPDCWWACAPACPPFASCAP